MTDLIARGVCLSQSLKDQGKSRTPKSMTLKVKTSRNPLKIRASLGLVAVSSSSRALGRNPLKIRASLGLGVLSVRLSLWSQSLKDQGKSRTLDSLAFARRQSFSLRKH